MITMKIRSIWWLNPYALLGVTAILVLFAFFTTNESYLTLYSEQKFVNLEYVLLAGLILILMAFGIFCGRQGYRQSALRKVGSKREVVSDRVYVACDIVVAITLLADLIWIGNFTRIYGFSALVSLFSPQSLSANVGVYRGDSGSISGITTFTEFGVVAMALLPIVIKSSDDKKSKRAVFQAALLIVLAVLRSLINSERLAIIELLVPFGISWVALSNRKKTTLMNLIPLFAVLGLAITFGIFEYSRSWLRHYVLLMDSFPEFVITRLTGYYTTAINNEAMFFAKGEISWIPYWSFLWFWSLPGMDTVYSAISNPNIDSLYHSMLAIFSNPEFTNQGGLLTYWSDFSWFGLTIYPIFGYLIGKFYGEFLRGSWSGQIVYPYIVLLLLELPRHFYLSENRGFLAVVALVLVFFLTSRPVNKSKIE